MHNHILVNLPLQQLALVLWHLDLPQVLIMIMNWAIIPASIHSLFLLLLLLHVLFCQHFIVLLFFTLNIFVHLKLIFPSFSTFLLSISLTCLNNFYLISMSFVIADWYFSLSHSSMNSH